MIAEDFRPVRVLVTESLVVPKGAFSRGGRGACPSHEDKEHVRAQGEKRPRAVPAFRYRSTPIRLWPNPTELGEGAASVLSSGNCAETGQ